MGTKKQADNVAEDQLMAMFGETIESISRITAADFADLPKSKRRKKEDKPEEERKRINDTNKEIKKVKLSETTKKLHKKAKAMLDAHGEYFCMIEGEKVQIVKG
jgi:hypothetical protein